MPSPTAIRPAATRLPALADDLLAAMGAIRRSGRSVATRPVELSALTGAQLDLVRLVRAARACRSRVLRTSWGWRATR